MSSIRVVRIVSGLWIGGVERKIAAMTVELKKLGFDVSVVCLREEGPLAPDLRASGIPVDVIRVRRRFSPAGLWRLRAHLRRLRPDLVHTHMYRSNTTGSIAAALAGVPVVVNHIHNVDTWDDFRQLWTDRLLVPLKDMFVFVSEAVRRNYTAKVPVPESLQCVIYNGIDTDRFAPHPDNPMNLAGSPRIGAATRLVPQKGLDTLIPLVHHWKQLAPDVCLYFLGDGPQRDELERRIEAEGLSASIRILGFSDRVHEFLRSLDLYVMPSTKEGFSNALLEAMASGVPCVATDVGGNGEAIRDGIDGRIVPPADPEAFDRAVQDLLAFPESMERYGHAARRRSIEFSLEKMVRRTRALYEQLVSRSL